MRQNLFFSVSFLLVIFRDVAIPAIVLGVSGRFLDRHFATGNIFFIILMIVSLLVSFALLKKDSKSATKELQKNSNP